MRRKAAPRLPRLEEFETTPQPYRSARGVASGRLGQAGPRSLHANAAQTPQTRAGRGGNEARQGVAGEQQAAPSHHRLPRFPSSRHGAWPSRSRRFGRSRHRSGQMPQGDHLASVGRVSGPHRGQARSEPALQLQARRLKEAHSRQGHLSRSGRHRPVAEQRRATHCPLARSGKERGLRPHRRGGTLGPWPDDHAARLRAWERHRRRQKQDAGGDPRRRVVERTSTASRRSAAYSPPRSVVFTAATSCFSEKGLGRKAKCSEGGRLRANASSA